MQSIWIAAVVVLVVAVTWFAPEAHGIAFGASAPRSATTAAALPEVDRDASLHRVP